MTVTACAIRIYGKATAFSRRQYKPNQTRNEFTLSLPKGLTPYFVIGYSLLDIGYFLPPCPLQHLLALTPSVSRPTAREAAAHALSAKGSPQKRLFPHRIGSCQARAV
jgi:hypothetical protein